MAEAQPVSRTGSSRYLTDRADITRVFRVLRDQRAQLALRFDDEAQGYTARVLDVDIGHFLLDDIKPRDGLPLLHKHTPFNFTGRTEGLYVFAEGLAVAQADSERGMPYFLVPFPHRVLYQQRRRAARFRLPLSVVTKGAALIIERNGTTLSGRIVDISAGGCRAEFDGPIEPPFVVDEVVDRCAVSIPNLLELTAHGTVRHHVTRTDPLRVSCGVEFVAMDITDRRRLEMLIQRITEGGIQAEPV